MVNTGKYIKIKKNELKSDFEFKTVASRVNILVDSQ